MVCQSVRSIDGSIRIHPGTWTKAEGSRRTRGFKSYDRSLFVLKILSPTFTCPASRKELISLWGSFKCDWCLLISQSASICLPSGIYEGVRSFSMSIKFHLAFSSHSRQVRDIREEKRGEREREANILFAVSESVKRNPWLLVWGEHIGLLNS